MVATAMISAGTSVFTHHYFHTSHADIKRSKRGTSWSYENIFPTGPQNALGGGDGDDSVVEHFLFFFFFFLVRVGFEHTAS
jgi:hypothetical protein